MGPAQGPGRPTWVDPRAKDGLIHVYLRVGSGTRAMWRYTARGALVFLTA